MYGGLMDIWSGLLSWESWVALATLTALEIVLGIDNLLVLAVLLTKVPSAKQRSVRLVGLSIAALARIGLLAMLYVAMRWTAPLLSVDNMGFSGRDLLLIAGGLFLLWKGSQEIYVTCEQPEEKPSKALKPRNSLAGIDLQLILFDLIFSLDSVITAVGMTTDFWVMATAILLALLVMLWASRPISRYLLEHTSLKVLALSFLIMLGALLIADGFQFHIPRGYLYFAIAFSSAVEFLNFRRRRVAKKS